MHVGRLKPYLEEQAQKKGKTLPAWMEERIKQVPACAVGTHIGKFSHPDAKVTIWDRSAAYSDGYVVTSSTEPPWDIAVNAAFMSTAKLLLQPLEDNKSLLYHIMERDQVFEEEWQDTGLDNGLYEALQKAVFQLAGRSGAEDTDDRLKQVYFPVGPNEYHLLTVMPASSLMFAVRRRIKHIEETTRRCREEKKDELYGTDHDELWDTTEISFGGTKPQNISCLNNDYGGTAYLLPSLPPVFARRQVRLPVKDFWHEAMTYRQYEPVFRQLHKLFSMEENNKTLRDQIKATVRDLLDMAAAAAFVIREEAAGWSGCERYSRLPQPQKIWLDRQYAAQWPELEWRDEVSTSFGRWFIKTYEQMAKQDKVMLGDEELRFFKYECRDALDEMVRYTI